MLQGSSQTCDVSCVNGGMQTVCVNNDGCCPAGCTTLSDNDCQPACGNTVVEAGETCDPPLGLQHHSGRMLERRQHRGRSFGQRRRLHLRLQPHGTHVRSRRHFLSDQRFVRPHQ